MPELAWAQQPFAPPPGTWLALHWRTLIVAAIALPFLTALAICTIFLLFDHSEALCTVVVCGWVVVGAVVAFLIGLVLAVRQAESEQTYVSGRQPDDHVHFSPTDLIGGRIACEIPLRFSELLSFLPQGTFLLLCKNHFSSE